MVNYRMLVDTYGEVTEDVPVHYDYDVEQINVITVRESE
jgi:hypothetical protein